MGSLACDQVREAIERNIGRVCLTDDDKPVEWNDDWVCKVGINYNAITDELNDALDSSVEELRDLVWDMWCEMLRTCPGHQIPLCITENINERMKNLRIGMDR